MRSVNLKLKNIWSCRCVIISLYFILLPCFTKAQSIDSAGIRFTSDNEKVNDRAMVVVEQAGVLQTVKFKEEAHVESGIPFSVSFENIFPKPAPFYNLRIFKDTILAVGHELLTEVTVIAKKYKTVQTLRGFEYKPYLDSDYLYKPLYYALEKLPFITAGLESISYKNGERILFMINGKERPGLLSWNELLKTMPAKQIYKVKMITELPPNVANRGYSIILDILTLDVNVYGHLIAPVLFWDSRNNFQPNLTTNWLKKRFDFSLNASFIPDKFNLPYEAKIYEDKTLISHTILNQKYRYYAVSLTGGIGFRMSASDQFSLSLGYSENTARYNNENITDNLPPLGTYLKNYGQIFQSSLGYIHSKGEDIVTGVGVAYNSQPSFQYNSTYFLNSISDSIQYELKLPTREVIAEMYHNNFKRSSLNYSYGLQGYITQSAQSALIKDRTSPDEQWNTNFNSTDSINFAQTSLTGYAQTVLLRKKRSFTFYLNTEYYHINSLGVKGKDYLLPTITYVQKELLKKNRSIKFRVSYDYVKPGMEYLISAAKFDNDFEVKYGNLDVLPQKFLSTSVELTHAAKFQLSQKISYHYSYDRLSFITEFDSARNQLVSQAQNHGKSHSIEYSVNFSKLFSKKLRVNANTSISYKTLANNFIDNKLSGWAFFISGYGNYRISDKYGLTFYLRTISNLFNEQGKKNGFLNYSVTLGRMVYKGKFAITLIAEDFFMNRRQDKSSYQFEHYKYNTELSRPHRLFKLRIAYRFSTIVMDKRADRFSPTKKREAANDL